ncbi:hypothetical protein [Aurantiacibacter spongiae]|uniref:Uncharacterized protein n=1 Tax=Aurantiacibacter spongiae TaxID=2488860 RepID=A0A3N5DK76_9SPHN|nr:hypothetical protein [Aurantiacibacter spongiae]RPF72102.1 hypothetical protein EG799_11090 [Aurantiacibacter spongiae]
MSRSLACAALILSAVLTAPSVATAQEPAVQGDMAARTAGARHSEDIGRQMTAVQAATASALTQYLGMTGAGDEGLMGAVALPSDTPEVWTVHVIAERAGEIVSLADYETSHGEILAETIHRDNPPPLTGPAHQMALAQAMAARKVFDSDPESFCVGGENDAGDTAAPSIALTTIVLPPDAQGVAMAYVLNGPFEEGSIPLGQHFRVPFYAEGVSGEVERMTSGCEVVTWNAADPDLAMSVYVTDYPGGAWPNEVHAFLSGQLPMSLGVVTGEIIWPMAGGAIAPPVPAAEAGYGSQ